ncbi:MAG: trypsin-like serine protease [Candidatus Thiodiazotropha taylori]|nr:trypsin-like serine protease [Candidatus Thiodiazotropha endolucinida]MCW4230864.1 trypsin-like serine protease [Candidatus Thiodiazotropha taylori]
MNSDDLQYFGKYIVPIYIRENGALKHEATGFIVNTGENDYLVSAAHVFRQCSEKEMLFITGEGKARLIEFNAMIYNRDTNGDKYDIGVMALLNHKPPYIAVGKEAISTRYLKPNCCSKLTKEFGIIGFPATKSLSNNQEKRVSVKLYGYSAQSCQESEYNAVGIASEHHFALIFNRKKCMGADGQKTQFPKPHGMSGSPIIYFPKFASGDVKAQPFIVGVASTYREKEKLIYGADISIALHFMKEIDDEIREKKALRKASH